MERRLSLTTAALLLGASGLVAQQMAPRETISTTVGGSKVSIEYGRPKLGERKVADLMKDLPGDRIWRTGTDQVTTLEAGGDVMLGGKKLPAGKYSLYVHIPDDGPYHLVVNSNLGVPLKEIFEQAPPNLAEEPWPYLQGYTEKIGDKEVARVAMKKATHDAADLFTMKLGESASGATLMLAWGDEAWSIDFTPAK